MSRSLFLVLILLSFATQSLSNDRTLSIKKAGDAGVVSGDPELIKSFLIRWQDIYWNYQFPLPEQDWRENEHVAGQIEKWIEKANKERRIEFFIGEDRSRISFDRAIHNGVFKKYE